MHEQVTSKSKALEFNRISAKKFFKLSITIFGITFSISGSNLD